LTRERELLKRTIYFLEPLDWDANVQDTCQDLIIEITALLAQTEQEPVAWIYERQTEDFTERTLSVGFEKNFDGITIPLYASPPKRKPLSNEDIANLEILSKTLDSLEYRYGFINGVLYAEKAHGIGVDDE
jgi:hypothetical protein